MRRLLVLFWLLAGLWAGGFPGALAAPPPAPRHWVTDGPGLLSAAARDTLDRRLQAYEQGTGHQVLVWIGDSTGGVPIEDWAVQAFAAWKVGRKGLDDGCVLFIFARDHTLRIEVGYGLEGRIPDIVAARIIRETLAPGLKAGDPDGAISAGVERILKVAGGDAAAAAPAPPADQPLGRAGPGPADPGHHPPGFGSLAAVQPLFRRRPGRPGRRRWRRRRLFRRRRQFRRRWRLGVVVKPGSADQVEAGVPTFRPCSFCWIASPKGHRHPCVHLRDSGATGLLEG